ncbi:MAG: hypothetical protein CYG60_00865 [Actinobacteria bacterium]|nr:MAG: hypothetical protein CYG60_00865 [Actinomycetota bacterium]
MGVRIDEVFDEGAYPAVLANVEEKETKFGNRLMWTFDLQGRNAEVVGFTSMSPSSRANAYAWAAAIMGGDINPGVGWGPEDVIGRACVVTLEVVEDAQGVEKNKVAKVKPPKNGEAPSRSERRPNGPDFGQAGF